MKNWYCLNPGEFFAAQELLRQRSDLELCFPIKDRGWDLLAIKKDGSRPVKVQVKESRVNASGSSWHQVGADSLKNADVFVFVSYIPLENGARTKFSQDYIVIPRAELERLCATKKTSKGKFSFYFIQTNGVLVDRRESRKNPVDVSRFHNAWDLI